MTKTPTWRAIINCMPTYLAKYDIDLRRYIRWLSFSLGVTAIFFYIGCEEEIAGGTGLEVLPSEELVEIVYSDTFSITMETRLIDSVPTCDQPRQLIGTVNDPQMGRITAATYTQVLPPDSAGLWEFGEPESLQLDSLVLQIRFSSLFNGDFNTPQRLEVYELTEDMPPCEMLSSRAMLAFDSLNNLAGDFVLDQSADSTPSTVVRIPLDTAFARNLLFAAAENYASDEAFVDFFKGLYITLSPATNDLMNPGAIYQIDAEFSTTTSMTMFFKQFADSSGAFERRLATYTIGTQSARRPRKFVEIKRDNTETTLLGQQLNNEENSEYVFIQAGSLSEIRGSFPSLADLPEETGINQAELILRADTNFFRPEGFENPIFQPNPEIELQLFDQNDSLITIGGVAVPNTYPYNPLVDEYRISFADLLQRALNDNISQINYVLRPPRTTANNNLQIFLYNLTTQRVILGGLNNATLAPELRLTFTTPE